MSTQPAPQPSNAETEAPPRDSVAYALRKRGLAWRTIANMMEYPGPRPAIQEARLFARSNGLPWPLGSEPMPIQKREQWWGEGSMGEVCYTLRLDTGLSWTEIGDRLDIHSSQVFSLSKKYALSRGLTWPLPGVKETLDAFYGAAAYELRLFHSWEAIARDLGISAAKATSAASSYAEENDLPPPKERKSVGERAYEIRSWGFTWKQVGKIIGTKGMSHNDAAKQYALREGLPWPLEPKKRKT